MFFFSNSMFWKQYVALKVWTLAFFRVKGKILGEGTGSYSLNHQPVFFLRLEKPQKSKHCMHVTGFRSPKSKRSPFSGSVLVGRYQNLKIQFFRIA